MKYLLTALFLFCLSVSAIGGLNVWSQSSGAYGYGIEVIIVDTTTTGRMYAGTNGFLISNDYGTTWQYSSITSVAPYNTPISIAINPKSPNEIYIYLAGGNGIAESTTYGYGNWASIANGLGSAVAVPNLLIDPENIARMYVASEPYGLPVYYSDDTGYHWTPSYSGITTDQAANYLIMNPTQHNILYAAAAASPGIYISYDGSTTWQSFPLNLAVNSLALDPTDNNKIYAGGYGGFASSFDGGSTWSISTDSTSPNDQINAVIVNPLDPMIIYVGTNDDGIYKSKDRGNTWTSMTTGLPFQQIFSLAYDTITRTLLVGDPGNGVTPPTGIWMYQDTDIDVAVEDWFKY